MSSLLFNIQRQNGKVQPKNIKDTITGKEYKWGTDKLTQITPEHTFDGKNLKIMAKDIKSAKHHFEKLKSQNKIPKDATYSEPRYEKEISYTSVNASLKFEIPAQNSNMSKSIVKSALALLSEHHYKALQSCKLAKDFLKTTKNPIMQFYYINDPIINRPFATPLHTVYIFNEGNNIYAYIELFTIARYKILLSDCFDENEYLRIQYSIDPVTATELKLQFNFNQDFYPKPLHPAEIQKSLIEEIQFTQKVDKHFYECIEKIYRKSSTGHLMQSLKDTHLICYLELFTNLNRKFISYATEQYEKLLQDFLESLSS